MIKIILFIFILVFIVAIFFVIKKKNHIETKDDNSIHYIALGDSYTIGEGIKESGNYPSLLTKDLQKRV